jgi:uncharacterized phage infection (PIP) family protein YhgE
MADELDGGSARTERWDARLGSLETRLEMLETGIRTEVERIKLIAETIDAVAHDFSATVGDTRNLVELTNDIGDRLTLLHSLEATVGGAAQSVADEVTARVDQERADRAQTNAALEQVLRAIATRVDRPDESAPLLLRINNQQAVLATRLDEVGAGLRELHDAQSVLSPVVGAIEALAAAVDARTSDVAAQVAQLRSELPDPDAAVGRLHPRLDQVSAQLADLRASQPDLASATEPFTQQLERITAEVTELRTMLPQVAHRLEGLSAELAQSRTDQPDPHAAVAPLHDRLDRLSVDLLQDRASAPDLAGRLDQIAAALGELRASPPDLASAIAPFALRIDQLTAAVADLRDRGAESTPQLDALAGRIEAIDARTAATNGALSEVHATTTLAATQVQQVVSALAALQDTGEGPEQVLAPVIDRLATVLDGVSSVHTNVAELAAAIGALRADRAVNQSDDATAAQLKTLTTAVNELRANRPDLTGSLQALAGLLEAVQADAARTHERLDALSVAVQQPPPAPPAPATPAVLEQLDARLHDVLSGIALAVDQVEAANRSENEHAAGLQASLDEHVADLNRSIDERVAADLQQLRAAVEAVATALAEPPPPPPPPPPAAAAQHDDGRSLQDAIAALRADIGTTNDQLRLIAQTRNEPRTEDLGGASAALMASAASAMARLEGRIDSEFDTVARQTEALGSLMAQAIEAMERIESQIGGVQPVTEKMRAAALRTLEALRTSRHRGGPRQLGR